MLFDSLSATRRLVQKARSIARHCFDMQNPTHAHRRFARKVFFERAAAAQKEFNTAPYRAIFADCLTEIGLSTNGLFRDTLGLRIAPPVKTHEGGFRSNVAIHRDTWGSGLQAQINWWLPVWPLTKERTMGFYPAHWLKPIANTTAQWSFKEFLASRKKPPPARPPLILPRLVRWLPQTAKSIRSYRRSVQCWFFLRHTCTLLFPITRR